MMNNRLEDRGWTETEVGQGHVIHSGAGLQLTVGATPAKRYSNAQITDYDYASMAFRWRPPLRMTVRAWFNAVPVGTAGFGFWNHPFSPDTRRLRLPQAIWFFFGAPPHNLALAYGVPGHGWKATTLDAGRAAALLLVPFAPLAVLGMQIPALYRRLYPFIQRRLAVGEAALDSALMSSPHTYTLEWRHNGAAFAVDGATVLETPFSPRGACGFIAWIDNQYAVVTPQGRFGWGVVPVTGEQSLTLEAVEIEELNHA
jgi:hypothetical protein